MSEAHKATSVYECKYRCGFKGSYNGKSQGHIRTERGWLAHSAVWVPQIASTMKKRGNASKRRMGA